MNYNMNAWVKTMLELHRMLKTAEMNITNKTNQVLMVKSGGVKKPNNTKRDHKSKGKRTVVVAARNATNNKHVAKPHPPRSVSALNATKWGT